MNTEDYLKKFIKDDSQYYYTEQGVLVYLEETLSEDRHLISHVHYVEYDDPNPEVYHTYQGLNNGPTFVYTGKLYKSDSYSQVLLEHDALKYQKDRKAELENAIAKLRKELTELENIKHINKNQFEDNKTFLAAFNLLTNTKRFVVVRDSEYRCYVIDNLDKKYIPEDTADDEESYYENKYRYRDIEFTFYREFSKFSNVKDKQFNYRIKLTPEESKKGSSWRDNIVDFKPDVDGDLEFLDTFEELNELLDKWLDEGKLTSTTYMRMIKESQKLKPSPMIGKKLKAEHIEREKNNRAHKLKTVRDYEEYLKESDLLINKFIEADDSDFSKINQLINDLTNLQRGR